MKNNKVYVGVIVEFLKDCNMVSEYIKNNREIILAINIEDEAIDRNWDALKHKNFANKRNWIEHCKPYSDQKKSLCSELLIRYYLMKYQYQNIELVYQYNEFGKPFIQGVDLCFNISHTENWVLCGFSKKLGLI